MFIRKGLGFSMMAIPMILENIKMVDAPPDVVWEVTTDVENWPQWTPTVTEVTRLDDGPFMVGSVALIKQPGLLVSEWRVTELRDGEGFTWETCVRGMRMSATHDLVVLESSTKSILRLQIEGFLAVLLWPLIRYSARKNLELENAGLKARCEAA